MRIVCLLKAVPDLSQVRYSRSERKLIEKGDRILAPVAENVLEAGRQIKERVENAVFVGVLLGGENDEKALRKAITFGLDQALMVVGDVDTYDHLVKARILKATLDKAAAPDILIAGDATGAGGGGQTGVRVAEAFGFEETSEVDEAAKHGRPCFLEVALGANEPRIPNVMAVMKAGSKEIVRFHAGDLLAAEKRVPAVTVLREEWVE